jgi:hypothetical protein
VRIFDMQCRSNGRSTHAGVWSVAAVVSLSFVAVLVANTRAADAGPAPYSVTRVASDSEHTPDHAGYNPEEVYPGMFESARLYKVVLHTQGWAGSRRPARVNQITCRDARTALEKRGFWRGQLSVTGVCGSGEPTEWATGNFLNFQASRHHEESDL